MERLVLQSHLALKTVCQTDGLVYRYVPSTRSLYYFKGKRVLQAKRAVVSSYTRIDKPKTYRDHLMNFYATNLEYTKVSETMKTKYLNDVKTGDYI